MSQGPSPTRPPDDESVEHRRLSRSPHPYHHQGHDLRDIVNISRSSRPNTLQLRERAFLPTKLRHAASDLMSRRGTTTSPSDTGTEADDERPLLKAITAPPLRPRKGLKGSKSPTLDAYGSPLPTPSLQEEEKSSLLSGHAYQERQKVVLGGNDTLKKIRWRRRRYRRAEFLRRSVEILLLGAVGYTCIHNSDHLREVSLHVLLICAIYTLHLPRLLLWTYRSRTRRGFWESIRLLGTTDPAPLIYPVILPLLVTFSAESSDLQALLTNYILSVSSMPRKAVPFNDFHIHWLISILPLIPNSTPASIYAPSMLTDHSVVDTEEKVLLFPLHCALTQTIGFLTTTSLLPAELQLLSVSLINLLGVPKTPQSSILKALLWVGGLALFVSCRHVSKLSVELARVPGWRFQPGKYNHANRSTIFTALDDALGGFLSRKLFKVRLTDSSDEELSDSEVFGFYSSRAANENRGRKLSVEETEAHGSGPKATTFDDFECVMNSRSLTAENRRYFGETTRPRRHTLPTRLSAIPDIPALTKTASDALSSARARSKLFLRLTPAQATVLKWLYACYVYVMVVLIIMIPLRLYVQYAALDGREPVGWALGYLFGDIPAFRLRVLLANFENWVCLPPRLDAEEDPTGPGEYIRQIMVGAANTRLLICGWCILNIAAGITTVLRLSTVAEVDTRRKIFHGMMVSMFLPTIFIDPTFVALAFALILAVFLLLDLFRASQLPPVSKPLTYFLAPYVDGRDHKGPIIISHFFLLIGCAIPLWLSLAAVKRTGNGALAGWEVKTKGLDMVSGVICVGLGDAAASLIGRRYGRRRWPWSGGKSLEGSTAFAVAVTTGLMASRAWLILGGWNDDSGDAWAETVTKAAVAACGASLTEAVLTGGNDNVIVPVVLWLLVRGLGI